MVIDFWATWCGPCKIFAPKFQSISERYSNVPFAKVNVEDFEDIGEFYGVENLPSIMVFKNGEKISVLGVKEEKLIELLDKETASKPLPTSEDF